jgi:biopolymer transport protein ExbD
MSKVNLTRVRAHARMAMRRREEEIEQEEMEGGELNLVPYLDIITNVVLFLLASVTTGIVLGTINSSLPEYAEGAAPTDPTPNPADEPALQLVVAVTKTEIQLFSLSGLEGSLSAPKLKLPASTTTPGKAFDYPKLTAAAAEIVARRWPGRSLLTVVGGKATCVHDGKALPLVDCRPEKASEIFLVVDGDIPYETVVATMDAVREAPDGTVLFPGVIFSSGIQ